MTFDGFSLPTFSPLCSKKMVGERNSESDKRCNVGLLATVASV
jgi:hypothetical protein